MSEQLDRKDLKIMAYKEKVSELLEANADLRVELTVVSQQFQEVNQKLADYEGASQAPDKGPVEDAETDEA